MSRFIDADLLNQRNELQAKNHPGAHWLTDYARFLISESPTVENLVQVVRCKNCVHRPIVQDWDYYAPMKANGDEDYTCPFLCADDAYYNGMPKDDFFCARGEVK